MASGTHRNYIRHIVRPPPPGALPAGWWMALREIIGRLVEGILGVITMLASFITMLTSKERKCIHDLIAGTVVLHDPNEVLQR